MMSVIVNRNFFYFFILISVLNIQIASAETLNFEVNERKFGKSEVLVELIFPSKVDEKKSPLIITQHGSTLDAKLTGSKVRTDEYSKRLLEKGLQAGFAVAVVDAFYTHDISPGEKHRQPWAADYASAIAKALSKDDRLDAANFFYSGFSYGGGHAHYLYENLNFSADHSWAGIVAAEPSCNAFFVPKKYETPILTLKGGESHYEPRPCEIFTDLYVKKGNNATLVVYPKSNHYFSHNGKITKGMAFNGCGENPVIMETYEVWNFLDGEKADRKKAVKRCITDIAGSGRTREDLNKAITVTIKFFLSNLKMLP